MEPEQVRKLVLLRHAKSAWPDDVPDHERPLARRGRRDAPAAGRWLRLAGWLPDHVVCSPARRTRETWQLAEPELGVRPVVTFEPAVYNASAGSLLQLVRRLPAEARTVLVIGHAPALPDLALTLSGDDEARRDAAAGRAAAASLDRMRAKFPTAAIAVLEFTGPWSELSPGRSQLASFVTPRELGENAPAAETRASGGG